MTDEQRHSGSTTGLVTLSRCESSAWTYRVGLPQARWTMRSSRRARPPARPRPSPSRRWSNRVLHHPVVAAPQVHRPDRDNARTGSRGYPTQHSCRAVEAQPLRQGPNNSISWCRNAGGPASWGRRAAAAQASRLAQPFLVADAEGVVPVIAEGRDLVVAGIFVQRAGFRLVNAGFQPNQRYAS